MSMGGGVMILIYLRSLLQSRVKTIIDICLTLFPVGKELAYEYILVCLSHYFNFWISCLVSMKFGMNVMPLEATSALYSLISFKQ
jgi:hypothetical protein